MFDEIEFESSEPVCSCCGTLLTFDEWELNGDLCDRCYGNYVAVEQAVKTFELEDSFDKD